MEVDFLVAKSCLQRKHNIVPVEVKSAREYVTSSLEKYTAKFSDYSAVACVLHDKDLEKKNGFVYFPVYMASFIGR